jgi:inner membrane protein
MTARTHDVAAITALALVAVVQPVQIVTLSTILAALLANQIGGIVPDIDQPTAPLWRNLPVGKLFGKVFDTLIGGHRFISHSLVGLVLFGLAANALLHFLQPILGHIDIQIVWWAFMIGIVSHLIMDTFTKEGVPWLLPLPIKFGIPPLKRLRVTTGTWEETFVVLPLLVAVDIWLFTHYYHQLVAFIHASLRS